MSEFKIQDIESYEYRKRIAEMKFSIIGPVVAGTYTDRSINAYFQRVQNMEIELPDGTRKKYSWKTMKWWFYVYKAEGYDGLIPKGRLDAGKTRKLDDTQKQNIRELVREFPKITGVMVYEKMIEKGLLNQRDCSVDTIQRYIRKSGLRNSGNTTLTHERRAWEYAHACDGYEADTCHTFYITDENGEYRKTYLIAIIDNHTRMMVGAEFFFNDNSANFHKVWHDAVLRYGRSKVLILDNGSSFKNRNTNEIAGRLGTQIIYNPPYKPTSKAVIERFYRTMKDRFLHIRHSQDYSSLQELNEDLRSWINEYNRTRHSALKDDTHDHHTPLERYMYDMRDIEVSRLANKSPLEYKEWLDDIFLHETTRKVNGDSTVMVEGILFDVPSIYISTKVLIRYDPRTFEKIYLYDVAEKKKIDLRRTDKVENGKSRREEIIY